MTDLEPGFRANAVAFINAIKACGASVRVAATYRPRERAYMMHYSSKIARGMIAADKVPAMDGVNIDWVHDTPDASKKAAAAMAKAFTIVYPPALISRHTERAAIDMKVSGIVGKTIKDASGHDVDIKKADDLHAVGATFGVHKLASDPPHWSDNGR